MKLQPGLINCIVASLLAVILNIQLCAPAYAQSAGGKPETIRLAHNGHDGYWLPADIAIQAQQDAEEAILLRTQVKLLDEKLVLRLERIDQLKEALELSKQETVEAKTVLKDAVRIQRQSEDALDGWFAGKPVIWLLVGVVGGCLLTALLISEK